MTPEQLFEENQAFAIWAARKFAHEQNIEDITQLALIGLFRATKTFDVTRGVRFTTYAMFYIKKEILRNHFENNHSLKVSRVVLENAQKIQRFIDNVNDVDEIAKLTGLSVPAVEQALDYMAHKTYSMDAQLYEEDSTTLGETIPSNDEGWDDSILFNEFMQSLDKQEMEIVQMRLNEMTQLEIGKVLNMHQMYVSRALKRIKGKYESFIA